ncbi:MAG TPA: ATP-dependent DNA ligase [Actinomycetes bacterium]|nr:ATP-dependent DNA ligase [Actinomycetes bacterium]
MDLPVMPPIRPMLARSVSILPEGMLYEPKWDGFRCIVFRDGDEVELGSRKERPLTRYFPEIVEAVRSQLPPRCVVDGEIVIASGPGLDFEALLQRIHPAASRVNLLAEQTPAWLIAFDLLALGDESLMDRPLAERRDALEAALAGAGEPVFTTPFTDSMRQAQRWFRVFEGAGLDGVVAKPRDLPYMEDERVMFKVKHERTADCVVAGFRWHKKGPVVGSLLLGLYDEEDRLQHVGVSASFSMERRRELLDELAPYRLEDGAEHPWTGYSTPERVPGAMVSRWNAKKDLTFELLKPELVVEVAYDHMEGRRFRHTAQFRRWRYDRDPASCTYAQIERPVSFDLAEILAGRGLPDSGAS